MRYSYATHLECSLTGERYDITRLQGLSAAKKPLLARYDLEALRRELPREAIEARAAGLWRWHELLPVPASEHIVSLGEVETPLIPLPHSARPRGFRPAIVKDEGRLPTGSFKARGLCLAVSMAHLHGVRRVAIPTNGNAGAAMAAYAAQADMEAVCFCPDDTPEVNLSEIALQGAAVYRVNGLINDCARLVEAGKAQYGWFDVSTLKEPYRIEGKKTMGLELADPGEVAPAGRGVLPDRRRHRPDRHVEGVAGARGARLDRAAAAAAGRRAVDRLRTDRARLRCAAPAPRRLGRTRTPLPPASACPPRSGIS